MIHEKIFEVSFEVYTTNILKLWLTTLTFTSPDDPDMSDKYRFKEMEIWGLVLCQQVVGVWVQLASSQLVWRRQGLLHLADWGQVKEGLRG